MDLNPVFERLSADNIQIIPSAELSTHFLFTRDGFVALVERRGEGFGSAGTPGLLTGNGMAQLVWRDGHAYFVGRGFERLATPEEVDQLRHFSRDLQNALSVIGPAA